MNKQLTRPILVIIWTFWFLSLKSTSLGTTQLSDLCSIFILVLPYLTNTTRWFCLILSFIRMSSWGVLKNSQNVMKIWQVYRKRVSVFLTLWKSLSISTCWGTLPHRFAKNRSQRSDHQERSDNGHARLCMIPNTSQSRYLQTWEVYRQRTISKRPTSLRVFCWPKEQNLKFFTKI